MTIDPSLIQSASTWLWTAFGAKIVERAGKTLGEVGRQAYEKIDWKREAEQYRGEMQMRYNNMRIIGMNEPVSLIDIFTDVFLFDRPSAWQHYNIEELMRSSGTSNFTISSHKRIHAVSLINQHERLMILGKPGAGKSTLLKHLVLQCTTGKIDALPIFVGLKAWSDSGDTLMDFLASQFAICSFPDARPFIEYILIEGKALVLFDGLDEVNLEKGIREKINRSIRDFSDQYPRSKCIITCRTAASEYQFDKFSYCELADFSWDQIVVFVSRWFSEDKDKEKSFFEEIQKNDNRSLLELARTPLLLTLLCIIFEETMYFPLRRMELYEEALDTLLKKWDSSRSIKRDIVYRTLSLSHKRQLLAYIAVENFGDNRTFIPQSDLIKYIENYMKRLPLNKEEQEIDGEIILQSIEAQHGLLVERSHRIYSFSHLTFHEYFTARYIADHPSFKTFRSVVDHAHDTRWREVLLLVISILDSENAEIFFDAFNISIKDKIKNSQVLYLMFQWAYRKSDKSGIDKVNAESYIILSFIAIILNTLFEINLYSDDFVRQIGVSFIEHLIKDYSPYKDGDSTYFLKNITQYLFEFFVADSEVFVEIGFEDAIRYLCDAKSLDNHYNFLEYVSAILPFGISKAKEVVCILFSVIVSCYIDDFILGKDISVLFFFSFLEALAKIGGGYSLFYDYQKNEYLEGHMDKKVKIDILYDNELMIREIFRYPEHRNVSLQDDYSWMAFVLLIRIMKELKKSMRNGNFYENVKSMWFKKISECDEGFSVIIAALSFPQEDDTAEKWQDFEENLYNILLKNKDVAYVYDLLAFNEFNVYTWSGNMMLECLKLANIENRDEIKNNFISESIIINK